MNRSVAVEVSFDLVIEPRQALIHLACRGWRQLVGNGLQFGLPGCKRRCGQWSCCGAIGLTKVGRFQLHLLDVFRRGFDSSAHLLDGSLALSFGAGCLVNFRLNGSSRAAR